MSYNFIFTICIIISKYLYVFVYCILAFLPSMIKQGSGHIIVVSSLQGKFAIPGRACCKFIILKQYDVNIILFVTILLQTHIKIPL